MYLKSILLFGLFSTATAFGQLLSIPDRDSGALEGSQVVSAITSLSLYDREVFIRNEVLSGNVPMFYRDMILISDSAFIGGTYVEIEYYVIPDYLALGSESDYFLCPMTPILAQQLADSTNCILPSRKMVDQIWASSAVKMNPESIPPSPLMTTVPVFNDHNTMVWNQRQTFLPNDSLGFLVSGNKKDVIISNLIYTSPPPARVVIYGWHYPSGTNIQPMYAGHIDTYADYSHGIRLVQNQVWVDGVPMLASDVLSSSTLYPLLSDEGVMSQPYYPDTSGTSVPLPPATPTTFTLTNENTNTLRLSIEFDAAVDDYLVYTSSDGINFSAATVYGSNNILISGLNEGEITFVKVAASNSGGTSNQSEVLGAIPSADADTVLIVNGFDRNSAGNSKNFIRQHGTAMLDHGSYFSSATNDAIISGMLLLTDYKVVDYILGEESTADETFDANEQILIANYLDQGGYLFVSGAEIGWDLDYLGSATDQQFYADYLRAEYVMDSPNDMAGTYYEFEPTDSVFNGIGNILFDDGTAGTYDVDYPDVINGIQGATNGLAYSSVVNNFAGVYFHGLFPNGTAPGKVVYFGVPFETVYPDSSRNLLMDKVMEYFEYEPISTVDTSSNALPFADDISVLIYPNPFNEQIRIEHKWAGKVTIVLTDAAGRIIYSEQSAEKEILLDASTLSKGVYFVRIDCGTQSSVRRIVKQ